jgi:hypothetical protein
MGTVIAEVNKLRHCFVDGDCLEFCSDRANTRHLLLDHFNHQA